MEFISWRIRPHAGLGVYERAPSGRISVFRAYEGPVPKTRWPRPPGRRQRPVKIRGLGQRRSHASVRA